MDIQIFTAGGTIDKVYSDKKGTLNFSFGKPAVQEILQSYTIPKKLLPNILHNIE